MENQRHRVYFGVANTDAWYTIMREARALYGNDWRSQPHVKKKLTRNWGKQLIRVWFEVPDEKFATWMAVKHSVSTVGPPNK